MTPHAPDASEAIERWVDQAATLLDLTIAPEHLPGVRRYFGLAADMAALVNGLPLTATDDAAESFVPIEPVGGTHRGGLDISDDSGDVHRKDTHL